MDDRVALLPLQRAATRMFAAAIVEAVRDGHPLTFEDKDDVLVQLAREVVRLDRQIDRMVESTNAMLKAIEKYEAESEAQLAEVEPDEG